MESITVSLTGKQILSVLAIVAETPELTQKLDLKLYDLAIMDSLKTVELIVAFSEKFGIEISPADLDREQWATPRLIVADMERRLSNSRP